MKIYQVDAFSDVVFKGNPAAVCPLEGEWLPDGVMLDIAAENNLSETAFCLRDDDSYSIRWFTPKGEVDLCGHATLATAHVLFAHEKSAGDTILFKSRSGMLRVICREGSYTLDFPEDSIRPIGITEKLTACFNRRPLEAYAGRTDIMLIFRDENEIRTIEPDCGNIMKLDARGIIVTAKGDSCDFVSRFFAPRCGVNEDPVTGSAHTSLVPYWSKALGRNRLEAVQLSERRGRLTCEKADDRILISGKARTYLVGEIFIR